MPTNRTTCRRCDDLVQLENICRSCSTCVMCCTCYLCVGHSIRHNRQDFPRCLYCNSCIRLCRCNILPFNANPLVYLEFKGKAEDGLYLGVELEVEVGDRISRLRKGPSIRDIDREFMVLKSDGTLSNGFEVVTAPASLDVHKEMWPKILSTGTKRNVTSWKTETCGFHVHVSRKPITPLTLGKILVFVNSHKTRQEIVDLAGRENHFHPSRNKCYAVMQEKKVTEVPPDRYQAVNTTNANTIEFRIFKGTLDVKHVLANIEFVDAVVRWCMNTSIREVESWKSFWSYVTRYKKRYAELITYKTEKKHKDK